METQNVVEAAATPAPVAEAGSPRPTPSPAGERLRAANDAVVAKHGGDKAQRLHDARVRGGKARWQGRGKALGASGQAPGGNGEAGSPAPAPLVDTESVRQMVVLGLNALDETLRLNMAEGWLRLSGDRSLAQEQAEFYGANEKQRQAIALFAGMTAAKYQAAVQFLPEVGLAVAVAGYSVNWWIGFNKLRQAAKLKAESDGKKPDAPGAPAN